MRIVRSAMLCLTMLIALSARAQMTAPPPDFFVTSNLVIVPTLVRSPAGELAHALSAADFQLLDNGVAQKVSLQQQERQPLALVVLLQTGGAASRQFESYAGLPTMLEYLTGSSAYRVALATFDSRPEDQDDFTSNVADLKEGLTHLQPGDRGAAVLDAVDYGIGLLQDFPPTMRRIILLLSQPQDDGSEAKAEDVVRRLGESNITIYSVTFSPEKAWLKDQFTKPRHENAPYQMDPLHPPLLHTFNLGAPLGEALKALKTNTAGEIASLSGGESMAFDGKQELDRQLAVVANHIPNRYMLSFQPRPATVGFHSVEVRVPGQASLGIAARCCYWLAGAP